LAVYTLNEFAGKLGELNLVGSQLPRVGMKPAVEHVAHTIMATSPRRLRGVGRGGATIGARGIVLGSAGSEALGEVRPIGPFHLIERDTRPHQIPREGNVGRKYAVFGGNVYSRADHPGTKGKHLFERGSLLAAAGVERIYAEETELALRRVF
jgi:hypothetical protein